MINIGYARPVDISAVLLSLSCGTYSSFLIPRKYNLLWCISMSFNGLVFFISEVS